LTMPLSSDAALVLGTAQLGSDYGRTNDVGYLSNQAALALLEAAYAQGVRTFDTARAYGASEQRIGMFVRAHGLRDVQILTKLDPLASLAPDLPAQAVRMIVRQSIQTSLENLGIDQLPVLMLHRVSHIEAFGGAVLDSLLECPASGQIGLIGASVNGPEELAKAVAHDEIRHVQLPFNLLDRRWAMMPVLRDGITIHVRSVFLQGLLANPTTADWPAITGYDSGEISASLTDIAKELGRMGPRDLAVAYVRGQPWVNGCVIGLEHPNQLAENTELFAQPPLTAEERARLRESLPSVPDALVQPWLWPAR
jgi:aryl-alcohol dehydrogenase-like predicted oxidoreductase